MNIPLKAIRKQTCVHHHHQLELLVSKNNNTAEAACLDMEKIGILHCIKVGIKWAEVSRYPIFLMPFFQMKNQNLNRKKAKRYSVLVSGKTK